MGLTTLCQYLSWTFGGCTASTLKFVNHDIWGESVIIIVNLDMQGVRVSLAISMHCVTPIQLLLEELVS
jgi:hypothetical protein